MICITLPKNKGKEKRFVDSGCHVENENGKNLQDPASQYVSVCVKHLITTSLMMLLSKLRVLIFACGSR